MSTQPQTRTCAKCGQEKPLADYDARFISKGVRVTCAACRGVADEGRKWEDAQARRVEREREWLRREAEERERVQREADERARRMAEKGARRDPRYRRTEGRPTDPDARRDVWIYAKREGGDYPEHTERGGKWMVFIPVSRIDAEWERIKAALHAGRLGDRAKVSTLPRDSREGATHVLIIYTHDGDDTADVWRVRRELHAMGYTWPIGWKADSETAQLHYAGAGRRVSRYWA